MSSTIQLKQQNLNLIRSVISPHVPYTKAEVAKITDLSLATCNNLLNEMFESGELLQTEERSYGGRKAKCFCYNKDHYHVIGIYLKVVHGIRNVGYQIANAIGEVIEEHVEHPDLISPQSLRDFLKSCMQHDPLIKIVSIAIPGIVTNGVVTQCNIRSFESKNLQVFLQDALDIPVIIENDMNFTAYGVYCASGQQDNILFAIDFPLDDCCGAGIIINGKVFSGANQFAGELSYALEEAGILRSQQPVSKLSKSEILRIVSKSITMVSCVLNPDRFVILCESLSEDDISPILEYCQKYLPEQYLPAIELKNKFYEYCQLGLIRSASNCLKFNFQLTI